MPFAVALSGLNAASSDLNVTANNIANANTTGFKASRAEFADVFAVGAQNIGNGVAHVVGDAGVLAGRCRLHRPRSRPRDQRRRLLHDERQRRRLVHARRLVRRRSRRLRRQHAEPAPADLSRSRTTARSTPARCPTCGSRRPTRRRRRRRARNSASTCRRMRRRRRSPTFDPNNASSYNHSTAVTIYDSLGASHTATAYFVKTATANQWDARFYDRRHRRRRREHDDLLEPRRADARRRAAASRCRRTRRRTARRRSTLTANVAELDAVRLGSSA